MLHEHHQNEVYMVAGKSIWPSQTFLTLDAASRTPWMLLDSWKLGHPSAREGYKNGFFWGQRHDVVKLDAHPSPSDVVWFGFFSIWLFSKSQIVDTVDAHQMCKHNYRVCFVDAYRKVYNQGAPGEPGPTSDVVRCAFLKNPVTPISTVRCCVNDFP